MNYRNEQYLQEDLQRLRGLRLIDDDFMTACFDNYIEGAQLLLNIILDRTDLTVTEVRAQRVLKSLQGRDVWLDIFALDAQGIRYNVEIQRADKGADRKRARYHSSMMDADQLKPGEDYSDLGESYVIFITENDVKYYVDVCDGQKTGFFLDQKYNRKAVSGICKDKEVLDCFTHTGSFALNAAKGGAKHVTAVDISETGIATPCCDAAAGYAHRTARGRE